MQKFLKKKGNFPERSKGTVLRTVASSFAGSNPAVTSDHFLKLRKKREKNMRKEFRKLPHWLNWIERPPSKRKVACSSHAWGIEFYNKAPLV